MLAEYYQWAWQANAFQLLKWMAYGYKDMAYFALKIMQRYGYLNHKYALQWLYQKEIDA